MFRYLPSYFLQSWGTKEMPPDFKDLLLVLIFKTWRETTRDLRNNPLLARA